MEEGLLHVRLSGTLPYNVFNQEANLFQPFIDACLTHKCNKILIDARDLQASFDTLELYRAGKNAAAMSQLGLRVAMLVREDMFSGFFVDVVHNRRGHIRIYTSMEEARGWLQEPQIIPTQTMRPTRRPFA